MRKEHWYRSLISSYRKKRSAHLAPQFKKVLGELKGNIPILIICYNNGVYVANLVSSFNKIGIIPVVIDNASTDKTTRTKLAKLSSQKKIYIIKSKTNFGHFVGLLDPIYKLLPKYFGYTDPDLQINPDLPKDFIDQLKKVTNTYKVFKAGFALDLLEEEECISVKQSINRTKPFSFRKFFSVREYEAKFWRIPIQHETLELFYAPIDSTFAIYNKENFTGDFYDAIRVGGNFSAIHLPWFPRIDIMSDREKEIYLDSDRKKDTTWIKNGQKK